MSRVNQAQMIKLLDLMSEEGVLVNGKVSYSNVNRQNFWKRVALQLNSVNGGVYKNTWKWCKMWADWKNKTKKKANILLRMKDCGVQAAPLTSLELRLLKMIDYPMDDRADVLTLHMPRVTKDEILEPGTEVITEYLTEEYEVPLSPSNKVSSDEEGDSALGDYVKDNNQFSNVDVDVILQDGNSRSELDHQYVITEESAKRKEKKLKKGKTTLEEYKLKTTIALEKERVQQKNEELRLRALELKLKGEELKQQEIQMNKINYLTNVEEEKLKCFREISSSLKELLECTRNGNIRFHNVL